MPTQLPLRVQPAGAREINAVVAMIERDEQVAYFASGVPLFVHRADDPVGRRVAAGQMIALGLARTDELSAVLQLTARRSIGSSASSRRTGCSAWSTASAGRAARIGSRPKSASGWRSCSRPGSRSGTRRSRSG